MTAVKTESIVVAPGDLGDSLCAVRLWVPEAQQQMRMSLSTLGQLAPVHAYRVGAQLELFDGLKRLRAARELNWARLRVEVHALDTVGAKVRLWRCNAASGLCELEEAWLVRSLYRDDHLRQPQIASLLSRHKSWVCRRLALAEGLSDELTAQVRLGLISATAAAELARLQRCNQDEVAAVVAGRGLTTRQTARLVEELLAAPPQQWPGLLEKKKQATVTPAGPKGGQRRRSPGEQMVADAWAMKRLAVRLHARLLERSLASLGGSSGAVSRELTELHGALGALMTTLEARLGAQGERNAEA
jgi:ParB-like chromosome segregation protein Spo0J